MPGLLIAAPSSGAGKTSVTLGLLRAFRRARIAMASAKAGPDYIDPAFHAAAGGRPCVNLDPWAMRPDLLSVLAAEALWPTEAGHSAAEGLVVEGMMGLFDGAADGTGASADLAATLGLSVVLVVDCAKQSHSAAALVRGFRDHRADVALAGVVLNRVGSPRHAAMLVQAIAPLGVPVLGVLPADPGLGLPERHLGLVQAMEHADLEGFLERAADWVSSGLDLAALRALARRGPGNGPDGSDGAATRQPSALAVPRLAPLGQRIAVARDTAFAFAYPHLLGGWRRAGASLSFFSPLADEAPDPDADAVYLPGGYPELHAGRLAVARRFAEGMRAAASRGAAIYGECGGYMMLGDSIEDADGIRHAMLGLLPLSTSFATRRRHLGYRRVAMSGFPWDGALAAHEFHYASIVHEGAAEPLLRASDAAGTDLGPRGLRIGRVGGSFLHVIDRA
ncbi:cobyrinate a,c-diamide synthase [Aureimonas glaciei]|uniref:Hydrogenobyrinate a,c-diamide synthase n=1 Tax=Aureimonas glaciei TaxID=1776957 RepID=A0A916XSW7_9HYPH|nr:cobyrinate a,c-diamide synthase [Aureimonas glaciei]GGD04720.1 hydrogenobyrinate a,c-diamide synthase [Aureimonas glaciei]